MWRCSTCDLWNHQTNSLCQACFAHRRPTFIISDTLVNSVVQFAHKPKPDRQEPISTAADQMQNAQNIQLAEDQQQKLYIDLIREDLRNSAKAKNLHANKTKKKNEKNDQMKKEQKHQPACLLNRLCFNSLLQSIKEQVIEYFLHEIIPIYIIPYDVIKLCCEYSENRHFILSQLKLIMTELQQKNNKHLFVTKLNLNQNQKKYTITNDEIVILESLQSNIQIIGKCKNIKIIIVNDLNLQCRTAKIRFHPNYNGGNIYIQCKNLLINNNACISTHVNMPGGYRKICRNNNKSKLKVYENGNICINAENTVKLSSKASINSGHISVCCKNNLEINDAYITSFGNGVNALCNKLTVDNNGCITSYNSMNKIRCSNVHEFNINKYTKKHNQAFYINRCKKQKAISSHVNKKREINDKLDAIKKEQSIQPSISFDQSHFSSILQSIKEKVIEYFLYEIIPIYIIPYDVIKLCCEYSKNHYFILCQLKSIMTELQQKNNKHLFVTKLKGNKKKYTVTNDEIVILNDSNYQIIGKCKNIKIVIINDLNLVGRIRFNRNYNGGNVYIQCNNLSMNSNSYIATAAAMQVHQYTKLVQNQNDLNKLNEYENGNIYINVSNTLKLSGNARINSGHISIFCGNICAIYSGSIRSFGNGVNILCNKMTFDGRGCIESYNSETNIVSNNMDPFTTKKHQIRNVKSIYILPNKNNQHEKISICTRIRNLISYVNIDCICYWLLHIVLIVLLIQILFFY